LEKSRNEEIMERFNNNIKDDGFGHLDLSGLGLDETLFKELKLIDKINKWLQKSQRIHYKCQRRN